MTRTKLSNTIQTFVISFVVFLTLTAQVHAAAFEFSPATGSYPAGCQRTLEVYVDVTGQDSNAADLIFNYSADQLSVTSVESGGAYQTFYSEAPQVNGATGSVRMTAFSVNNTVRSRLLFARVNFTSVANATSANFVIQATLGNTIDSNIAETSTSQDILTSVTNGSYTFTPGNCASDTGAPTVVFVSPTEGQSDFPSNGPIQIRLEDEATGVNLDSLSIIINGRTYTATSPEVTISGNAQNYLVTIQPAESLPSDAASSIAVNVSDLSGNSVSRQNIFNMPSTPGGEDPGEEEEEPTPGPSVNNPGAIVVEILTSSPISFENTPFAGTIVEQVFQELGTAGTVATVGLAINLLPFLTFLNAPGLILNLFAFLLGRKHKRPWGLVMDASTGKPIPYAAVRIFIAGSLTMLDQTVSDNEGRYGFTLAPGKYRLEVSAQDYSKFIGEIEIAEGESSYVLDIRLSKGELGATSGGVRWKLSRFLAKLWRLVYPYVFALGFALALVNMVLNPILLNGIVLGLYLIIIGINLLGRLNILPRNAAVVDSATKLRIPNAVVKIFETDKWELVDTIATNDSGLFDFYGEPGKYAVLVAARGYTFPSRAATQPVVGKYKSMVEVNLVKGGNRIQLEMDPSEGIEKRFQGSNNANLPNPFA